MRAATRARPSPVPPLHARRLSAPCTSPPHLVAALLATPPRPSPVGRPNDVPRWRCCVPILELVASKLVALKLVASKLVALKLVASKLVALKLVAAVCQGSRPSHPTLRPALPRSSTRCTRCSDCSRPLAPRERLPGMLARGTGTLTGNCGVSYAAGCDGDRPCPAGMAANGLAAEIRMLCVAPPVCGAMRHATLLMLACA